MTPERYQRLADLFAAACELSGAERSAHLDRACAGEPALRAEIESLLAGDDAGAFLTRTALTLRVDDEHAREFATPEFIGRYRVVRLLGEGGMGAAYEAQQENPHRLVAVKTIRTALRTPRMLRRFEYEAQILGRLRHPGIAQIFEAGLAETSHGQLPFIAMELVQGVQLDDFARRTSDLRQKLELFAHICDAVQHAHQQGVIHRDLKPGNILVEVGAGIMPMPKILDFGVARLTEPEDCLATLRTEPGALIGTLPYMSPEQVSGDGPGVDTRSDVYALGVILFELLTGRTPLDMRNRTVAEAMRIICEQEAPRARRVVPTLHGDIETICAKALEKERQRRYQTASELAADVRRYLRDEPINARPSTMLYQLRKFTRRNRGLVVGVLAALMAIVAGAIVSLFYAYGERAARRLSDAAVVRAEAEEKRVKWTNYRLHVAAAQHAIDVEPLKAQQSLDAAPAEFRNWEWRHLQARLDATMATAEGDGGTSASVAFSSTGEPLAALVRAGAVEIVDLRRRVTTATIGSDSPLSRPVVSGDGSRVAAWSAAGQRIEVFDATSAEKLGVWAIGGDILDHQLNRSGQRVIAAVTGRGLESFDVESKETQSVAPANIRYMGYGILAMDDAGELVASSGGVSPDYPYTAVWERSTGSNRPYAFADNSAFAFRPFGAEIAIGGNNQLAIVDNADGNVRRSLRGRDARWTALAWSADGKWLAGSGTGATAQLFDMSTGVPYRTLLLPFVPTQLALSLDGTLVACAFQNRAAVAQTSNPAVTELRGHTSFVYLVAWSPDGQTIASAGWDLCVRVWNARDGAPIAVLGVDGKPSETMHGLAFSADGAAIVALSHHGIYYEWDRASGQRLHPIPNEAPAQSKDAIERYWNRARGGAKIAVTQGGESESNSRDGARIARCLAAGVVSVVDRDSGAELYRIDAHAGRALAVAFSSDGTLLATGGNENLVKLWRASDGTPLGTLEGHARPLYSLAFSPDGTRLVSGSNDTAIILWDVLHREPVMEMRGHSNYVHSVSFSPDGSQLASGSGDGSVRLWRAR
ncbi:MAG: protein kinase domain-containing protein [Phycisphaerae bacterium]